MVLSLVNYCITLNSFHDTQSLDKILENLVRCNYDGIEIEGTPNQFSWKQYRDNIKSYNLSVIGVTGAWTKRDVENGHIPILLTNDYNKLSYSITYIQNCIKMCNYLGGNLFNICLLSDYSELQDFNHTYIFPQQKIDPGVFTHVEFRSNVRFVIRIHQIYDFNIFRIYLSLV